MIKPLNVNKIEEKLRTCKNLSLEQVQFEELDEITEIKIDKRKSSNERILDFLSKVKNPYIFKVKGRIVQIEFSKSTRTADECLTNVLKKLYRWLSSV